MEAEVAELNAALKVLQDKFQEVMDDKASAEAEAAKCASKLDMATLAHSSTHVPSHLEIPDFFF